MEDKITHGTVSARLTTEGEHIQELPKNATTRDGKVYNSRHELIEFYQNQWHVVKNGNREGWWRYHSHYDRDGYCDNPARGY